MTLTSAHVVGNVTRDPELRYTPSGAPVLSFSVAVNTRRRDGDQWVDGPTQFYTVTAWRGLAENAAATLAKGMRVLVVGRLAYRTWTDDEGRNRTAVEVEAELLGPDLTWATAVVHRTYGGGRADRAPLDAYAGDPNDRPPTPATTPPAPNETEEPF